jgi:hypothetical protein
MKRMNRTRKYLGYKPSEEKIKEELKKMVDKYNVVHLEVSPPRDAIVCFYVEEE